MINGPTHPDSPRDRIPALGGRVLGACTASQGGDPEPARGPAVPTRPPVMVRGEAVWPVVCATRVRDIQAKMPEDDDEPDDEPKDEPEDESGDEPGTLYFGHGDGWMARFC